MEEIDVEGSQIKADNPNMPAWMVDAYQWFKKTGVALDTDRASYALKHGTMSPEEYHRRYSPDNSLQSVHDYRHFLNTGQRGGTTNITNVANQYPITPARAADTTLTRPGTGD